MPAQERIHISGDIDIVTARSRAKDMAVALGFSRTDQTVIAAAVSEVARNIVVYADEGELVLRAEHDRGRWALVAIASDEGPGIPDVGQAMADGYSTAGSLGVGLPGARRLMDALEVESEVGRGTTVTMRKWADGRG